MTSRGGIQELEGHHSAERKTSCAQTGGLDCKLTSNLGGVLGIHGEGSRGQGHPRPEGPGGGGVCAPGVPRVEWPLPPSPAGPREVRARASRPPLRPRARGRSSSGPDVARRAGGPPSLLPVLPTPCFRPPPPRQGAPLGAGPQGGPVWVSGDPGTRTAPCPPRARGRTCPAAYPEHPSVQAGGGSSPPRSFFGDHRPAVEVHPRAGSAPWQAAWSGLRTCALRRSLYPSPGSTAPSRAPMGLLPLSIPGHLAEPR